MKCPECDVEERIIADGKWVTEEALLSMTHAPKTIKRQMNHQPWCTKQRPWFAL